MTTQRTAPALRGYFAQLGYVTRDIDGALERFRIAQNIPEFLRIEPPAGTTGLRAALAYKGGVMYEIIQPVPGAEGVYADALPETASDARLHHIAYVVADLETLQRTVADFEAAGFSVPVNRDTGRGVWLVYIDTRATTGHYTELLYLFDAGLELFARTPGDRIPR